MGPDADEEGEMRHLGLAIGELPEVGGQVDQINQLRHLLGALSQRRLPRQLSHHHRQEMPWFHTLADRPEQDRRMPKWSRQIQGAGLPAHRKKRWSITSVLTECGRVGRERWNRGGGARKRQTKIDLWQLTGPSFNIKPAKDGSAT